MKVCILDGKLLDSGKALHRAVSEALDFPDWYGENLDALYDCPCATTGISCAASSSKSSFCSIHAITQMRPVTSVAPSRISYSPGVMSKCSHPPSLAGTIPFARRIIPWRSLSESSDKAVLSSSLVNLCGVSTPQLAKTSSA